MIGLQNAGKTSLLRVLAVGSHFLIQGPSVIPFRVLILFGAGRRVYHRVRNIPAGSAIAANSVMVSSRLIATVCLQLDTDRGIQHEARSERPCNVEMVSLAMDRSMVVSEESADRTCGL